MRSPRLSPLSLPVFLLLIAVAFANGQTGDSAQLPTQDKPAGKTSSKVVRHEPQADTDSADIPPFASHKIDDRTYLRLRDELIGVKRGTQDLRKDPGARSRAIGQMEQQEKQIRARFLSSAARKATATGLGAVGAPPAWVPLGPDPIPNGQTDTTEVPVSGRVTAIAVDPTNANLVYVGTAQGGLYRSTDGGATWLALMETAKSLAIGCITIDPMDRNTLFIGTGEGNFSLDSFFGVGVYIIKNASTTHDLTGPFNLTATASDIFTGRSITQILVNPANDSQILVSTASGFSGASGDALPTRPARGLYFSTNALAASPTFALEAVPVPANRSVTDMTMDPGSANTIVINVFGAPAAGDGGLWVSTSGNPWTGSAVVWTQELVSSAIAKLAVNRSGTTPATTFFATFDAATACGSGAGGTMSKSTDGGVTWVDVPAAAGFCGGQCFYDMVTTVDPSNVNNIYLAGSAGSGTGTCNSGIMGKSIDGGATFAPSQTSLHADSHATVIAPSNHNVMYAGNDGGIFRSADAGATWTSRNTAGFQATQFESIAVHPTDPKFTIGGTQDNGTEYRDSTGAWIRADFGDGGFSAIDQGTNSLTAVTMYHTYFNQTNNLIGFAQVNAVANATEGNWNGFGCGFNLDPTITNGINCNDNVLFYAPLALGPGTPNTVYFGTQALYRSIDTGNNNVTASQSPLATVTISGVVTPVPVSAIGISPQDDNVRIVGLADGQVFATSTGATTLADITGPWGANVSAVYVARAVIDPASKTTAYITLDGYGTPTHVWKTMNLSSATPTWTAVSGSSTTAIPDVPVNAFAVDPLNTAYLYAGTDIGVFNSTDGGATWNPYGTGLPRVAVFDLAIQPVSHVVRIGTHGRGAWEIAAVGGFATTTGLVASPSASGVGDPVVLTATIGKGSGTVTPTGTVTFTEGATALGSHAVDGTGAAAITVSTFALGAHTITATYSGNSLYATSTGTGTATVMPPDYSVTAPTGTATVSAGSTATYSLQVNPLFHFTGAVTLTGCTGLPTFSACTFTPAMVAPTGGVYAPAMLTISTSSTGAAPPAHGLLGFVLGGSFSGIGLLGLVFLGSTRRGATNRKRIWLTAGLLLVMLAAVAFMPACGSTPVHGTTRGTTTVTVTSTSGTLSHTTTVSLTVN